MKIRLSLTLLVAALTACDYYPSNERDMASGSPGSADATPQTKPDEPEFPDPSLTLDRFLLISYEDDLQPLLASTCTASCHKADSPDGNILLDNTEALEANASLAISSIRKKLMPPAAAEPYSVEDQKKFQRLASLLKKWQNDSHPLNQDTYEVSYLTHFSALNQTLCTPCHAKYSGKAPSLLTYDSWVENFDEINSAVQARLMPPGIDDDEARRLQAMLKQWEISGFLLEK